MNAIAYWWEKRRLRRVELPDDTVKKPEIPEATGLRGKLRAATDSVRRRVMKARRTPR